MSFNDELKQKRKWVSSFLKKLWCCVGGRVKQEFGLIKQVDKGLNTTMKDLALTKG